MGRNTRSRRRPSRFLRSHLVPSPIRGGAVRLVSLVASLLVVAACASSVPATPAPSSAASAAASAPGAASAPAAVVGATQLPQPAAASTPSPTIPATTPRPPTAAPTRSVRTPAPTPRPTAQPTRPPITRAPGATTAHLLATIVDFGFRPASLSIGRGTTVTWTNGGQAQHTVTSNGGLFASAALSAGASFSYTFRTAGTYAYHCAIHPFMTATIVVH